MLFLEGLVVNENTPPPLVAEKLEFGLIVLALPRNSKQGCCAPLTLIHWLNFAGMFRFFP